MMDILSEFNEPSVWWSTCVCFLAIVSYLYYENTYKYWDRRSVKGVKPWPIVSEIYEFFFTDRCSSMLERAKKYGKVYGTFSIFKPRLVIADAEIIRQICIKDFHLFQNHQLIRWSNKYQAHFLLWIKDDKWKRVRAMMSPAFTSGKIKRMFKLIDVCADDLVDNFREHLDKSRRALRDAGMDWNQPSRCLVDLYDLYGMYTMDGITSCCYGIKLKREIDERADGVSRKRSLSRNSIVDDCRRALKINWARVLMLLLLPSRLLDLIRFQITPDESFEPLIDRISKIVDRRRKGDMKKQDDLLQMLLDARLDDKLELSDLDRAENHHAGLSHDAILNDHQASVESTRANQGSDLKRPEETLTDIEILSEAALMLFAGFDTTRISLSSITYLLSHNQRAQDKLYEELKKIATFEENQVGRLVKFDYDSLTSCEYLDAVISESLRFHTPAPLTDRVASEDYYIEKYKVQLRKGEQILLGLYSVHNDPDYWDEPRTFRPERFLPGKDGRDRIVAGSYAPFSMGPRHCIGMRFSLTETKLGLAKVLMRFKFEPSPGAVYPPKTITGSGLAHIKDCRAIVSMREED